MIKITKTPNADTRSAKEPITEATFMRATKSHIDHVGQALNFFADELTIAGVRHDWTKIAYSGAWVHSMRNTQETGRDFTESDPYKLHVTSERHHLLRHEEPDVNLIDVLEFIADYVVASMARDGVTLNPIELPNELLQEAFQNTIEMLWEEVEVEE